MLVGIMILGNTNSPNGFISEGLIFTEQVYL